MFGFGGKFSESSATSVKNFPWFCNQNCEHVAKQTAQQDAQDRWKPCDRFLYDKTMTQEALRKIRVKKAQKLRRIGIEPFPSKASRTHSISAIIKNFDTIAKSVETVILTGRIRSVREHGGSTFFHFEDESETLQGYVKKDNVGKKDYQIFLDLFDIGDIVELRGTLFATKRGEKTLLVSSFRMLSKSLLPLPDKWHGLQDVEERFRKRYLDLVMNRGVRDNFKVRSKVIYELRSFLANEGFMEVETPILQPIPGGARAKPFKTRLNALKLDLYLRIAPELYLKRLLVGGFEKVFEIGRVFRNEGMDAVHNPDFTMIELYAAHRDYRWTMDFMEKMLHTLATKVFGKSIIQYGEYAIDLEKPFEKIDFTLLVKKYTGIDIWAISDKELEVYLQKHTVRMDKEMTRANMIDELYKEFCLKYLIQPTFVIYLPIELNPLAKANPENRKIADRFQLVIAGIELVNAFSELNDPIEQEKRLKQELKDYKRDAKRFDSDFIEALEYGMPPAAGMGMGIDRLVMLFTNSHAIREIILFPTMRPKRN